MESIIILASSYKLGGICLAGKRLDGRWVRPVPADQAYGWREHCLKQRLGHLPAARERIAVPALAPAPQGHQPENCLVASGAWSCEGTSNAQDLLPLIDDEALWSTGEHSGSGINDRISLHTALREAGSSLRLVRPEGLRFVKTVSYDGNLKLRARFSLQGTPYDLCVTDASALKYWLPKLANGHDGLTEALLCISLSLPLNGYCYKLVAGVIELH